MCLEAGMPLQEVSERSGHEDISTTNEFYIHITDKMKKTSIEKLENYMSELLDE